MNDARLFRPNESILSSPESLVIRDLLSGFTTEQRAAISRLALAPLGIDVCSIDPKVLRWLLKRFPATISLDDTGTTLRFHAPEVGVAVRRALGSRASEQTEMSIRKPVGAQPIPDDTVNRIIAAQTRGDDVEALRLFREGGGYFFIHFHGLDACLRVLQGFPESMQKQENVIVFAYALHALKSGNVSRARHLVGQRFGPEANDLKLILSQPDRFSLDFRLFRFLMAMYEDIAITDAMRAQLFDALGEVPLDDHLQRGGFYNAMLETFVRRRQLDTAAEFAQRARFHYRRANAHLLGFYIDLYQAILCLMGGAIQSAESFVRDAEEALERVAFESKSDERILGLVKAVVRYEQGNVQSLVRFLNEEIDQFAYGEIWPTVAELAINYGGQALSRHVAVAAARVFLDKWRVQEWRSNRFRLVIVLREVAILQNGNRWQEAAELLTAVQSRINRTWVESAIDNLVRLVDPQEIALALAWLRHFIWEVPARPMLRDQLSELLKNGHLSGRQRIAILVWSAHLARVHRDMTGARSALLKALESGARLGTIMSLVEEAGLLGKLLEDKRIKQFVLASGDARQIIRKLKTMEMPISEGPRRAGLTRQETKVLLLVAEGGTNKYVARQLGLSEVTVKFHLSNIYRKIGCRRRAEAVATAKALGWVV